MKRLLIPAMALVILFASGCGSSVKQTYEGYSSEEVWAAMVLAARTPEYSAWNIVKNEVWADPEEARLEIYRLLDRDVRQASGFETRRQEREWRLQIVLESVDPPTAVLTSRGKAVPVWVKDEGNLYFDAVKAYLGDTLAD